MIIAIDFDGTCVKHKYPEIGESIGAEEVLRKLIQNNHQLILNTMRSGETLQDAIRWFKKGEIPLFGVNSNPTQSSWTQSPKVYAHLYIDDAALNCPLIKPFYFAWELLQKNFIPERPYANWSIIQALLEEKDII